MRLSELTKALPETIDDWDELVATIARLPPGQAKPIFRLLCRTSLYFLLRYACGRIDMARPWLHDRCLEVQKHPDGYIDLWAREHYKSTIITFGKSIQDILASHGEDPLPHWKGMEVTIGIFSHTRPIAKQFLRQIKNEFESNSLLKEWFPDVLWKNPMQESSKWGEDDGIVVKRRTTPRESTVEAWGLVDGQPTGKHFFILTYDDVVTLSSVGTPEMINKTTAALELSYNLGAAGGCRRFIGTRYHYNDTYREVLKRQSAIPRIYPATVDGTVDGEPRLLTKEVLAQKRRDQGPYTYACQMLQDPKQDDMGGFQETWLRYYDDTLDGRGMNTYILVDPANEKRKLNDWTAVWVIGLGADGNYYVLDMYRDRLNLTQRTDLLFKLHRKWRPYTVVYEKYGMQADIQHFEDRMQRENYRFDVQAVGGQMKKTDRIRRLLPLFETNRFYLPHSMYRTNYEGHTSDLVDVFIQEEYKAFPVSVHDDMLDALSRIADPDVTLIWPRTYDRRDERYTPNRTKNHRGRTWASV